MYHASGKLLIGQVLVAITQLQREAIFLACDCATKSLSTPGSGSQNLGLPHHH